MLTPGAGRPRRSPSTLRSSSTSGQWMPKPAPAISQFALCAEVALAVRVPSQRHGNPPSILERDAQPFAIAAYVSDAGLEQKLLGSVHARSPGSRRAGPQSRERSRSARAKHSRCSVPQRPAAARSSPATAAVNMDVRRLTAVMAVEIDAVSSGAQNRRHHRQSRISTNRPAIAAAAAIAGETRCVRPLKPWRPSKLRFEVEAQRSPRLQLVGVHAEAHRAAGLAPVEAGLDEDAGRAPRPRPAASPGRSPARSWR